VESFKVLEIKKSVFENNDRRAALLREELLANKTLLLNLMSSPGSGKTTTVLKTIEMLRDKFRIGVMEADIDSDVDAKKIADAGIPVVQVHTGGMCHLDAEMTRQGLSALPVQELDLVILENVGNLVCPAEFDTGAAKNVMILSVPEGDDKPLKYPLMFSIVDVLLINKMDAIGFFDFNLDAVAERARAINPDIEIFPISAKTGEGMESWTQWLATQATL
jgi:hydrogenase nickel incorporation protein HypB